MMPAAHVLAGAVLWLAGRRLFWVFVAVLGFFVGMDLATRYLPDASQVVVLVLAIVAGLLGAVLAGWFYEIAIGVAGFLAGGRLGLALLAMVAPDAMDLAWLAFVLAGILGALVLLLVFDWALIVLSSFVGAGLIVEPLALSPPAAALLIVGLALVGVAVQARAMWVETRQP